jgi:hypothetical protein
MVSIRETERGMPTQNRQKRKTLETEIRQRTLRRDFETPEQSSRKTKYSIRVISLT